MQTLKKSEQSSSCSVDTLRRYIVLLQDLTSCKPQWIVDGKSYDVDDWKHVQGLWRRTCGLEKLKSMAGSSMALINSIGDNARACIIAWFFFFQAD